MRTRLHWRLPTALWLALAIALPLLAVACRSESTTASTPPLTVTYAPPAATPTVATLTPEVPGATPAVGTARVAFQAAGARSSIAVIDSVLASVEAADVDALLQLVTFSEVRCLERPVGVGSPPKCPSGTVDGTSIAVFPFAQCEGSFAADLQQVAHRPALG